MQHGEVEFPMNHRGELKESREHLFENWDALWICTGLLVVALSLLLVLGRLV